jgi:hypothetical protein
VINANISMHHLQNCGCSKSTFVAMHRRAFREVWSTPQPDSHWESAQGSFIGFHIAVILGVLPTPLMLYLAGIAGAAITIWPWRER